MKQEIEEEAIRERLMKTDPRFARLFKEQQRKKDEKDQEIRDAVSKKDELRKVRSAATLEKRIAMEEVQKKHA